MHWILRWLTSRTFRQAVEFSGQVRKVWSAQRDLLSEEAVIEVARSLQSFRESILTAPGKEQIVAAMTQLEVAANKSLKPYPSPGIREHIEMLLVVAAVVLACRAFFFQPMAIPSGSAQPTLWGIRAENLIQRPEISMPAGFRKFYESWVKGRSYYHVVAKSDGSLRELQEPKTVFPFVKRLTFTVGDSAYNVWFPPDKFYEHAGLYPGLSFKAGQEIVRLRVTSGDHLFVNTLTYNFRPPHRGEIVVFESRNWRGLIANTHYIKRLVALGGDRVRIGDDRHLIVNGERLDASTRYFENVYSFKGPPVIDEWSGHVNDKVARENRRGGLAPLFPDANTEFVVRPNHYLTMGDNTMNSHDSRAWGDFPREFVIGKCGFVFWPITDRFGWAVE